MNLSVYDSRVRIASPRGHGPNLFLSYYEITRIDPLKQRFTFAFDLVLQQLWRHLLFSAGMTYWRHAVRQTTCSSSESQSGLERILSWLQRIGQWTYQIRGKKLTWQFIKEKSVQLARANHDASVASTIYVEFRELLIQELEKVDDRFFDVCDNCQEELDELAATVLFIMPLLITVAQWSHRGGTKWMVWLSEIIC